MSGSLFCINLCRTCAKVSQNARLKGLIPLISRAVTLLIVIALIGVLPWLSGGEPALALLRARSGEQEATAETLNAIRQTLGLEQGPFALLIDWLGGLLQGDAGNSWVSGKAVLPAMLQATAVSLTLMACAALVAILLCAMLCSPIFISGLRGKTRKPAGLFAAVFTALPEFLLASFLLIIGAIFLRWFPPYGWQGWHYAVLPSLALGIPAGGYLGRIISDAFAATFSESWITTWSAVGINRRHLAVAVLKRTLPSVMPLVGMVLVSLTGGAIAVEKVFAIPGLGRATLGAAAAQDLPALQAGILILLLLAMLLAGAAHLCRLLILGPALNAGSMPLPATQSVQRRGVWLIPLLSLLLLVALVLAGLWRDPFASAFTRLQSPSFMLPFGADAMGRDLLARVAHGTWNTCLLAFLVSLACLAIGIVVGIFPRWLNGLIEVTNAMPPVIAGLLVAAVNGPTEAGAALAVIAVSWAPLAAHTASLLAEIKARPYIKVLPLLGVSPLRQTLAYFLPALMGPLFRHAMLRLPGMALALASLGFLGLGAAPPTPEWGRVLAEGMPYIERSYWGVAAPAAALALLSILAVSVGNLSSIKNK